MKLLTFTKGNTDECFLGALVNNQVLDLNLASGNKIPKDMLTFIQGGEKLRKLANDIIKNLQVSALYSLDRSEEHTSELQSQR